MKNLVHRLSDPRDPAYPFSDTYICSNCNERLQLDDSSCSICNMNIHGMVNKSATNTADQLTNGIKADFVTIKKAKNIPTENYIPKKSFAQADDNSVEVSSLFKESVILVFILGSMLIGLIVYDLNQNIVKTRGNNLEIVD